MLPHCGVLIILKNISVAWRKAFSVLWNVLRETHRRVIAPSSEFAPLSAQLKAHSVIFMFKTLDHDNSTLKYVTKLGTRILYL